MSARVERKNPGALVNVLKRMKDVSTKEIAVGFPEGMAEAYPDGTRVVDVAARHVYGIGVPVRDFMSLAKPGIAEKTAPLLEVIGKMVSGGSDADAEKVSNLQGTAGEVAAAVIKTAIVELDDPPNAPATIAAKGSDNPLVDTSHMKNSVTYIVRDKK